MDNPSSVTNDIKQEIDKGDDESSLLISFLQNDLLIEIKQKASRLIQKNGGEKFQEFFLEKVLQDNRSTHISPKYKKMILGSIISLVENENCELNETIVNLYLDLMYPAKNFADFCQKSFFFSDHHHQSNSIQLRVLETFSEVGMISWTAGFVLADYILSKADQFKNKRILEMGTGIGLTAMVMWKCVTQRLVLTDHASNVLSNLKFNLRNNSIPYQEDSPNQNEDKTTVCHLDWIEPDSFLDSAGEIDHIFGADLVYDPVVIPPLARFLREILKKYPSASVYFASTQRNPQTFSLFLAELAQQTLTVETLPLPPLHFYTPPPDRDLVQITKITLDN